MKITEIQLAHIIKKNSYKSEATGAVVIDFDAAANQINELMKPKWKNFEEWFHHSDMSNFTTSLEEIWHEARK